MAYLCFTGNLKQLKEVVERKGLDCLNQIDSQGYAPVHYAVMNDKREVFDYLVSLGKRMGEDTNTTCSHRRSREDLAECDGTTHRYHVRQARLSHGPR